MDMVTIPREEYERLKRLAGEDADEYIQQLVDDLKAGRVHEI